MTADLNHYLRIVLKFLGKYHAMLFFLIASVFVAIAIVLLYLVLQTTSSPPTATSTIGDFDKATADKIKTLNDSSHGQDATVTLPSPRPNPFVE